IIKSDYYKIRNKVLDGKAHELSEGDTLYVGACTKSSNSSITTSQPFNDLPAKPRAFSFKSSYMTYILRNYVNSNNKKLDKIVDNKEFSDFESLVLNKLKKYYKRNELDLFKEFNIKTTAKQKYSLLTLKILGVKTNNAEEFQKANIEIKTIKHEPGKKPKESMSFPKYKIQTLVKKDWYDSDLYKLFSTKKFLFIEFLETENGTILNSAKFWNMPYEDLNGDLKKEWEEYKNKYKKGINLKIKGNKVENDLPKMKDTRIIHSRPHSRKSAYYFKDKNLIIGNIERDADMLPNGDMMTTQSFWLNNSYVYEQIKK
ncbi:MAG: Sau3AI family type II restriction endonuclease, partial [Anaerococcus hydrogenalis]|nr:Sau3AI family type II restriction endonuclease [Anaerococcus hydrogenalis]